MEQEKDMLILEGALKQLDIYYDNTTLDKLKDFREKVLCWNKSVNLTAITNPYEFEIKHLADSISCCAFHAFKDAKAIIDVGTGAGFPGIPLAICFPEKQFTLLDSLKKRIKIIDEIKEELGLKNVRTIHGRAEDLAVIKEHREQYDLCLSRAVANLATLTEYSLPFVSLGGYFAAYKTKASDLELKEAKRAIELLGGKFETSIESDLDGINLQHVILWIKKIKNTPSKYPRKAGVPSKNPII